MISPTRDAMIAETAEKFLNNVLRVPAVKMVIAWELADNYSFYTDAAKKKDPLAQRLPRPLPFDSSDAEESRSGSRWRAHSRMPERMAIDART